MKYSKDVLREMIGELNGKIFSVDFVKKDGTLRSMLCRTGVQKGTSGEGLKYDPVEKGLISVYDMKISEHRMINLNTVKRIKLEGKEWEF